jgi:ABC-type glycerol-3-phosphate transport system substrate-binding protein
LNYNSYKRLYNAGAMRVIPESVYAIADIEKDFSVDILEPLKVFDGKYYYVPWELHPQGTVYNKSLLEREGFTEPPSGFDEFLEVAQACVKKENDQVVQSGLGMDGPYMFLFTVLLPSIGGEACSPYDETPDKMRTDEAAEAFELLADYEREHDILHPAFSIGVGGWWAGAYLYGKQAFCWWISGANITLEEQTLDKGSAITTDNIIPKLGPEGFRVGTRPNWGPSVTTACPEEKLDTAWKLWKYTLSHEELAAYSNLTLMPSPRISVQEAGREIYPEGPRGDEAVLEIEAIKQHSFLFGQPENESLWREAFQDTYDGVIGGMTGKEAIEANWSKFQEGWTGEA